MKCYDKIYNPLTGRKVSIYGKLGKKILKTYLQYGGEPTPFKPVKKPPVEIPVEPKCSSSSVKKTETVPWCASKCVSERATTIAKESLVHPHPAKTPFNDQKLPMELAWFWDQSIPKKK